MKIAYLYYDLLNLYGENGNIKAITNVLDYNKIKYKVIYLSLNDKLDFNKYDLVYIGSGTEENQKIALEHLLKYQDNIKEYIKNGGFMLATGNSLDLFGKKIKTKTKEYEALGIFNYEVTQDERVIKEVYIPAKIFDANILGFINNNSHISKIKNSLFEEEGIHSKNFYGTYIIGPILVRNPEFLKYFLTKLIGKSCKYDLEIEQKAYQEFIKNFRKD